MSLTICLTTPDGVVLAADSRQTYRNIVGAARIGSDSATKIFSVNEKVGVTVAGPAFLKDPNEPGANPRGIGSFINSFLKQMNKEETVKSIAEKLGKYLEGIYKPKEQLDQIEKQMTNEIQQMGGNIIKTERAKHNEAVIIDYTDKDGKPQKGVGEIMPISLIVAGYDIEKVGKPELSVYQVYIPGEIKQARKHKDSNEFGANWTGQTDVITRIVLGRDPRIDALEFVQAARQKNGNDKITHQLGALEYNINWGAMTLADAVDFSKLMIETTSAIQRYSDGIKITPGDMPGVGGPVDVAVILPNEGFHWHQRKELKLEKQEIE